jgi:hypothetical protein
MLYSSEDVWRPTAAPTNGTNSAQCIVLGLGSTAFPRLLGQQSPNAKISVALGKLPWGFASSAGGPIAMRAWEAVVWGDTTYCTFVVASPPQASWSGVAGFIKSVFRWNAPSTQSMDISGIEASAEVDPTVSTGITTHTGMMNAAARYRAGTLGSIGFMAGELAFITAATNNPSVTVDLASWALDNNGNPIVLGNVQQSPAPTYAESVFSVVDNGDGTVGVLVGSAVAGSPVLPSGITDSTNDLLEAYHAWQNGTGSKPIPRRCAGALALNAFENEPIPHGKCDAGLSWSSSGSVTGAQSWSAVTGLSSGPNTYMQLSQPGGTYSRATDGTSNLKSVLSEIYVHLWSKSYDL